MPDTILRHVAGMTKALAVPCLEAETLGEAVFTGQYVAASRPCVIRGAVLHWAAARLWGDPDYLKSRCGHHRVFYFPHENHITLGRMMAGKRQMGFAEALDHLHAPDTEVATLMLTEDLPELRPDLGRFSFLSRAEPSFLYPPVRYFIYRNAGSTWHYHPFDETLMCQMVGSKRIGLLSARTQSQEILQQVFLKEDYYEDASTPEALEGADLQWFSAVLEAGDALYIPPLWWHGVVPVSRGFGMTAAIPWRSPLPVVADAIRRMAAGEIAMMGSTSSPQFQSLLDTARQMGLEKELALAWQRAQAAPAVY